MQSLWDKRKQRHPKEIRSLYESRFEKHLRPAAAWGSENSFRAGSRGGPGMFDIAQATFSSVPLKR